MTLRRPAAAEISTLNAGEWRSFNLIIGDVTGTFYLRGTGQGRVHAERLPPGTHIVTARDPNDRSSPRVARNLPRFRKAARPSPPDWSSWQTLLADNELPSEAAINIPPFSGFGTVSSALIGLSADAAPTFLTTAGPPHTHPFEPVAFG